MSFEWGPRGCCGNGLAIGKVMYFRQSTSADSQRGPAQVQDRQSSHFQLRRIDIPLRVPNHQDIATVKDTLMSL